MGNEFGNRASLLRRVGVAVTSGVAGALLLTGCAAGQQAQTVEQTPSIDGVQAEAGSIAIRAAGIAAPDSGSSYAKGATAMLRMVIVNRGAQQDELVSVSSPAASGAQLTAAVEGSGSQSASSASATTGTPSASASGSATASPASGSPSASGSGSASAPIVLPPGQAVQVGMGTNPAGVTLTGLTADLFPSQSVPVTLTFNSGASVTLVMAVQLTSEAPAAPRHKRG